MKLSKTGKGRKMGMMKSTAGKAAFFVWIFYHVTRGVFGHETHFPSYLLGVQNYLRQWTGSEFDYQMKLSTDRQREKGDYHETHLTRLLP